MEEVLTEEERKAAWEEYENEKKGIVNTGKFLFNERHAVTGVFLFLFCFVFVLSYAFSYFDTRSDRFCYCSCEIWHEYDERWSARFLKHGDANETTNDDATHGGSANCSSPYYANGCYEWHGNTW